MITAAANFELLALGPDKASAALRCILVHGTAARDAPWVQFESALSQSLMTLDPGGVRLYKFLWSGANAQVDRLSAADWLAEKLAMQAAADPEAKFLLIGHSHGGNICSNAIKGVPSPQRVGVVCLATPFLNARARSLRALRWARAGFSILNLNP